MGETEEVSEAGGNVSSGVSAPEGETKNEEAEAGKAAAARRPCRLNGNAPIQGA